MITISRSLQACLSILLCSTWLFAQEPPKEVPPKPAEPPKAEQAKPADQPIVYEEVTVVTASRTEQVVHDVPASVSVLTSDDIASTPADNVGDLLRNVPGLNVSQMSARDISVTGRAATNSLATSQLVLLDNRTLYLDFFGFVMWDFVPLNPNEIKQIEVVRGPGSAVWGANAMTGVINVITKRPYEMIGTTVMVGGGELGAILGSFTHAAATSTWGYKLSASYYEQDAYDRPTGTIDNEFHTPYPPFQNEGTTQPKVDARVDWDSSPGSTFSFAAGYAGTDGLVHTGIGPFDVDQGAFLSYAKIDWTKQAMRISGFANYLDADSTALLAIGVDGKPIPFAFKSDTYNIDFGNTSVIGTSHILTYGGNARKNNFDLSIAPNAEDRNEYGVYLQDEILFGDKARWLIGARWDDMDPIGQVVSPRTALMISPIPNQTIRLSYNRAFRAPSVINNYLQTAILNQITLPTGAYIFPSIILGNPDLTEEQLDAYEIGYVGTWEGVIATAAVYRNESQDSADFFTSAYYNSGHPPPGWPLPPFLLDIPPLNALPAAFSYRNIGEQIDKGVELSLNVRRSARWSWFASYSWQDKPEVTGIPEDEVNIPPEHRANVGMSYDTGIVYANASVNYQDDAFWTDVLDARYHGPTDSFTSVNASLGYRFSNQRATLSVTGTNIFDEEIQQHVFGDIISRKIVGQLSFRY